MATQSSGATSGLSLSLSDAEVLLMSIEAQLWSLDRTPQNASTIQELERLVADVRQGLRSIPR